MMKSGNPSHTILYVHSSDEMYGADLILLQLVERLDKQQFRAVVTIPTDVPYQGLLSDALRERGIETIQLKMAVLRRKYFSPHGVLIYLWRLVVSTLALIRLIRQESVDIVHSNTAAVIPGALAAFLTSTPHIWHIHEIIVHPQILRRLTAWLLPRLSKRVVAVSGPTRDHLCETDRNNKEKTIVIHNGIDVSRFKAITGLGQSVREEWGIAPDQPLVGMVGRVSHWKGQGYFLQVASRVAHSHPEAHFALVGGTFPGQEDLVRELRSSVEQLNLSSTVTISDFRSDIPSVLDAYDIFVLPSTLPDPFPTVILEAMAAGKPVVANAHGGSIEMVDHGVTGFLVEPGQPDRMAAAINRLLDDPTKRHRMGLCGQNRITSCFSLEPFVAQWANLYKSIRSVP
jgi:glycosyltransferase involved in cell wall biosynthesis